MDSSTEHAEARARLRIALAVALAAMVVAVYWRVGGYPFVILDDEPYILKNPALQGSLSAESVRWAFTADLDAGWIPLTWLSRLLDVSLFGMDAGAHHRVNLLLHLANTLLLFHVLRRMTGAAWRSALAAALFGVHPLHVESVAWVTERKDVLSGFFFLLTIRCYAGYCARPGFARYAAVWLSAALAMLSKPMAVTLPFALLLLDLWPLRRLPRAGDPAGRPFGTATPGRLLLEKAPLLLLSAGASAITLAVTVRIGAVASLDAIPFGARAGNAALALATYLRKTAWPTGLAVFYPHPGGGAPPWQAWAAGLLLCAATALAVQQIRRRPYLAAGWFWYAGTLAPVLGLVQAGGQAMADRYSYLPLIGIFVIAAWGLVDVAARFSIPRAAVAAAAAAWLAALGVTASAQTGYWRDSAALYRRALSATEGNWIAEEGLGLVAFQAFRGDEAIDRFRNAIRIRPAYANAHWNLAKVLLLRGERLEGMHQVEEAVRLDRRFAGRVGEIGGLLPRSGAEVARAQPDSAEALLALGAARLRRDDYDGAVAPLGEAIRLQPGSAEARNLLGVALAHRGKLPEAIAQFREAIRIRPDYAGAFRNLGRALDDAGQPEAAVAQYREADRLSRR